MIKPCDKQASRLSSNWLHFLKPPWDQDSSKHTATTETEVSLLRPVCSFFGRYFKNVKHASNNLARSSCADGTTPIAYAGSKDTRPTRIVLEAWARRWGIWADQLLTCPWVFSAGLGTGTASCSTPEGILVLRQHVGPWLAWEKDDPRQQ